MFLIDAIKPNIEKKFKLVLFVGEGSRRVQNKTSFVSLRVRFVGNNKNIIQKERENVLLSIIKKSRYI